MGCPACHVRLARVVTFTLFGFLLLTQTACGDYLLTLRSGLHLRVQTFTLDGATIQLWTEFGSMTLPIDTVAQITEHRVSPSTSLQHTTAGVSEEAKNEDTGELHHDQGHRGSLYIPDEQSLPRMEEHQH